MSGGGAEAALGPGAARAPADGSGGRLVRRLVLTVAALAVLAAAVLVLGPQDPRPPLDPDGTGHDGLRGVRDLLAQVDVDVAVSTDPPQDSSTRLFVPLDLLSDGQRERLLTWVDEGGTLVVADPQSALHGLAPGALESGPPFGGGLEREPACDLLEGVGDVEQPEWPGLEHDGAATTCFPVGDDEPAAWLVARDHGAGRLVALGSATPFTNGWLDEADNAVLAAALLGPEPGDRLRIVPRPEPGEADGGLLALVPGGVWRGLALSALALVLFAVWRGRRVGAPVPERLPPVVPSAELAGSVGGLLQRAGDRGAAASRLRGGVRRDVERALARPPGTDPAQLAELAEHRAGVARADAKLALLEASTPDDDALQELAAAATRVRTALSRR